MSLTTWLTCSRTRSVAGKDRCVTAQGDLDDKDPSTLPNLHNQHLVFKKCLVWDPPNGFDDPEALKQVRIGNRVDCLK